MSAGLPGFTGTPAARVVAGPLATFGRGGLHPATPDAGVGSGKNRSVHDIKPTSAHWIASTAKFHNGCQPRAQRAAIVASVAAATAAIVP